MIGYSDALTGVLVIPARRRGAARRPSRLPA